jgi:hypothetical protein
MTTNISLVEVENNAAFLAKHGNLYNTRQNIIRRRIGKCVDVFVSEDKDGQLGTVRHLTTGKYYDWWYCADQTLCIQEAE